MHSLRLLRALLVAHWSLAVGHSAPASPERIVTLGAAVTETVFALGAGDQVVARDTSSVFPEAARALPDVGYFRTIGAEGVLALRPTLVLAAHGAGPAEQMTLLKNSGVPLLAFTAAPSGESTLDLIARVGAALRREPAAALLAEKLRARLASSVALRGGRPAPRVLFLLGVQGGSTVQAAGDRTAAAAFLALLGADNAIAGSPGYKTLGAESVLALDPDVILYGVDPSAPAHTPPDWLASTRAGREGRARALPLSSLAFGPRLGESVLAATPLLYPPAATTASR
jgi:iron complex transport system substrate-binding protein